MRNAHSSGRCNIYTNQLDAQRIASINVFKKTVSRSMEAGRWILSPLILEVALRFYASASRAVFWPAGKRFPRCPCRAWQTAII
jgi:hypothetical protein